MDISPLHMPQRKRIALIAHDNRKPDLLAWARYNKNILRRFSIERREPRFRGGDAEDPQGRAFEWRFSEPILERASRTGGKATQ